MLAIVKTLIITVLGVAGIFGFFYWLAGREPKRVKKLRAGKKLCVSCGKWKDKKRVRYLTPAGYRLCDSCYMGIRRQIKDGKYD